MESLIDVDEQARLIHENSLYFDGSQQESATKDGDFRRHVEMASSQPLSEESSSAELSRIHLDVRAIHTSCNIWPKKRAGRNLKNGASRAYMHGVEIRTLVAPHLLTGQTGLFAAQIFSKFDIIGEYCGMVHGQVYAPAQGNGEYCANLEDVRYKAQPLGLDAQTYGNEGRVINHFANIAEAPNVIMSRCHVEKLPRVMLVCTRDIQTNEEFLLDYGVGYASQFLSS